MEKKVRKVAIGLIVLSIVGVVPLMSHAESQDLKQLPRSEKLEKVNIKLLSDFGITNEEMLKLGDDIEIVEQLIQSNDVKTERDVANLKNAFLYPNYVSSKDFEVTNDLAYTDTGSIAVTGVKKEVEFTAKELGQSIPYELKEKNNELTSNKSAQIAAACSNSLDGYHYIVRSNWNKNKASGNISLPWGIATTNWNGSQNEIPYFFFGIYSSTASKGGADAGIYFDNSKNRWYPFFNGWNATEGYVWKSVDKVAYDNSTGGGITNTTPLQLIVTQKNNAIEVKLVNRTNWTEISTTNFSVNTYFGFNSAGTNTRFNKETSLATHCYNGTSGAYTKGSTWSNTYIYSTTGYSLWDASQTIYAEWKPNQSKVTQFANVVNYYQDTISIEFN